MYGMSGKVRFIAIKLDQAPHIMGVKLIFGEVEENLEQIPWHSSAGNKIKP